MISSRALRAELLRRSFAAFARWVWPRITGVELVPNHATDAVTAALSAVADGKLTRLILAMPPGVGKSTLLAAFAAYRLARNPAHRAIHAAHAFSLAASESRRVRRLVEGDDYRRMFPSVSLRADESSVELWATTQGGCYRAVGTDTGLTGFRALEAVLDDPLAATDRFSKATCDALMAWFGESLSTRLDGDRAPIIIVSQRLGPNDLAGQLLAGPDAASWTLLELAAEFSSDRRCSIPGVWTDPRTEAGELLAPGVLSREKCDGLKAQIGSAAWSTQYLQRVIDDTSALLPRRYWNFYTPPGVSPTSPRPAGCDLERFAVEMPKAFSRITIAADLTFGSLTGDYAVVQAWGASGSGRYLLRQFRQRCGFEAQLAAIRTMADEFPGAAVVIEKAANGAAIGEQIRREISTVQLVKPVGPKAARIGAMLPTLEAGSMFVPLGWPGLEQFIEECGGTGRHDDIPDCAAWANHDLNRRDLFVTESVAGHAVREYRAQPSADLGALAVLGGRGRVISRGGRW